MFQVPRLITGAVLLWSICPSIQAGPAPGPDLDQPSVTLAWEPSPADDVAGYRIYYGVESRAYTNYVDAGTNCTAVISNLVAGCTYYFAATAFTADGLESDYSNEVIYTVPISEGLLNLVTLPGAVEIAGRGLPGRLYSVDRSTNLIQWTPLNASVSLGADGSFKVVDRQAASGSCFYRLIGAMPSAALKNLSD